MSQVHSKHGAAVRFDLRSLLLPAAGVCGGVLAVAVFALAMMLIGSAGPQTRSSTVASTPPSPPPSAAPAREVPKSAPQRIQAISPVLEAMSRFESDANSVVVNGVARDAAEPSTSPKIAAAEPQFGAYYEPAGEEPALPAALAASPEPKSDAPPPAADVPTPIAAESPLSAARPEAAVSHSPRRREPPTEDELRAQLLHMAPGIQPDQATLNLVSEAESDYAKQRFVAFEPTLSGLTLRMGDECHLPEKTAKVLGKHSVEFRRLEQVIGKFFEVENIDTSTAAAYRERIKSMFRGWTSPESVPSIEQMFQVQAQPLRMVMIELLSEIRTEDSTVVLARRALYDLDDEVRLAAALELRSRRREHYQPTLVDGFRYPWEQVAWNAADALIALDDKDLALDVVELLDEPDPSAPYLNEAGNWAVREVASINHLRNCQLCHARSTASSDPVRGLIPPPGQPLPQVYYQSKSGNFVRADFTYIKQDFSVIQPVEKHQQWPKLQRLDYVVRERELTPLEYPLIEEPLGKSDERNVCPQHLAVIYALRTLTGKDAGARAEVWREILRGRLSLATPPERTPLERMLADRR